MTTTVNNNNTDGIRVFRTGKTTTIPKTSSSRSLNWMDVFDPLFKSFEQCTLKSVESINTKMFGNVRDYLTTSSLQMKSSDCIPTSIVIAADTDQNVHFRQLATFLEGKRCVDGRKEWIVVRLCHSDPDESRTPAAI